MKRDLITSSIVAVPTYRFSGYEYSFVMTDYCHNSSVLIYWLDNKSYWWHDPSMAEAVDEVAYLQLATVFKYAIDDTVRVHDRNIIGIVVKQLPYQDGNGEACYVVKSSGDIRYWFPESMIRRYV